MMFMFQCVINRMILNVFFSTASVVAVGVIADVFDFDFVAVLQDYRIAWRRCPIVVVRSLYGVHTAVRSTPIPPIFNA